MNLGWATQERFWSRVQVGAEDECWPWKGPITARGYGWFSTPERPEHAHRVAYALHAGEPAPGLFVCHTCDNPPCVNPRHLFEGSPADNAHDRDEKGRNRVRFGEDHPNHVLTWDKVREIRRRWIPGVYGVHRLARDFGVSHVTIGLIVKGLAWPDDGGRGR